MWRCLNLQICLHAAAIASLYALDGHAKKCCVRAQLLKCKSSSSTLPLKQQTLVEASQHHVRIIKKCNDEVPTFLGFLRRESRNLQVWPCDATCDAALDCPGCSERCCDSCECAERLLRGVSKISSFRSL